MKKSDEIRIREAVDRRLSSLEASAVRRARIRQRIEREEEPVGKRKMTMGMALALIAVLALSGIAVAAGMNLFERYGMTDERIAGIAGQAALTTQNPETVESDELGRTTAVISEAYYDGQTLIAGYQLENAMHIERCIPTAEQIAGAVRRGREDSPKVWLYPQNEEERAIVAEFEEAMVKGEPYGAVLCIVEPGNGARTDDGVFLPGSVDWDEFSGLNVQQALREFDYPLPEEAQNRDSLSFSIELRKRLTYLYFDGKDLYVSSHYQDAGQMSASVQRTEAVKAIYQGGGSCEGVKVQASAELSPASGVFVLTAEEGVFANQEEEYWTAKHRIAVFSDDGMQLEANRGHASKDGCSLTWYFYGNGREKLPNELTVYLIDSDRFESYEQMKAEGDAVVLHAAG